MENTTPNWENACIEESSSTYQAIENDGTMNSSAMKLWPLR